MTKGRRRKENFEKREKSKRLHFLLTTRASATGVAGAALDNRP